MNLINCSHRCIYQSDGYCTLKSLNGIYNNPINDCIYFSPTSSKQSFEISDILNGDEF